MWIALIIILAVIIIGVLWVVSTQRTLVHYDELCQNSLSQIGVQQETRWDALTSLAQLTADYSKHEHDTLMDVIGKRQAITKSSNASDVELQENMITEAMSHIMAVAEAYPDLKANTMYENTMNGVKQYEENVRRSRMVYNDTITKLNRYVRQIPACFIAKSLGFGVKEYLKEPVGKTDMPSMKVN